MRKNILAIFCMLICVLGLSVPSFAAGTIITYDQMESAFKKYVEPLSGVTNGYKVKVSTEGMNDAEKAEWEKVMTEYINDPNYTFVFTICSDGLLLLYTSNDPPFVYRTDYVNLNEGAYFNFTKSGSFLKYSSSFNGRLGPLSSFCCWSSNFELATNSQVPSSYRILDFDTFVIDDGVERIENHILTVQYQYSDGTQAADPVTQTVATGTAYEIVSPVLEGYTTDKPVVSGTMPDNDLTVTVTYTAVPPVVTNYTLTVKYLYENGTQAAESVVQSIAAGTAYNIPSPTISNYDASQKTVSGMMPEQDLTIVVTYRKKEESSSSSGYPDFAPDVDWHNPFEWFDVAPNVEWHDPFAWFDIAPNVEWHNPFSWE